MDAVIRRILRMIDKRRYDPPLRSYHRYKVTPGATIRGIPGGRRYFRYLDDAALFAKNNYPETHTIYRRVSGLSDPFGYGWEVIGGPAVDRGIMLGETLKTMFEQDEPGR